MTTDAFRLLMISAMYENGGNTTHRSLDGHPQLYVYPFESQVGTRLVRDHLTSTFPVKYRWPVFALDASPAQDFMAIIDEETRVRSRTPNVSKFRDRPFDLSDDERGRIYEDRVAARGGRSRGVNVAAFYEATFEAWHDRRVSGREEIYVGYSPIVVVDADKIVDDLPGAHVLHVVRNPWSAYADTKKRPVPLGLPSYLLGWTLNQYFALLYADLYPGRVHIVRIEDVMADPISALKPVCDALGIDSSDQLKQPSWNGEPLREVYPWGTIRKPSPEANRATAEELSEDERADVRARAGHYLEVFDYKSFI